MNIPIEHRFILTISPSFFVADSSELKWPTKAWADEKALVKEVAAKYPNIIGLRRFYYDPARGQTFVDKGWLYFGDLVLVKREDALAKDWQRRLPGVRLSDIARSNIKINGFERCVYIKQTGNLYDLRDEDRIID